MRANGVVNRRLCLAATASFLPPAGDLLLDAGDVRGQRLGEERWRRWRNLCGTDLVTAGQWLAGRVPDDLSGDSVGACPRRDFALLPGTRGLAVAAGLVA